MTIEEYLDNINTRYNSGISTEHTFRGDLQQLIESLVPGIQATNEPKRQKCGAPDYILSRKGIDVGYIEAKDIGDKDLFGKKESGNKEQFDRYKSSLNNLIFTDYVNFILFRGGEFIAEVSIAKITENGIIAKPENFDTFKNLLEDFCEYVDQTIKSSKQLAKMMAGKARLLSDILRKSLESDVESQENSSLKDQLLGFQQILIHDIGPKEFADVYSQTITYGLFAARLHDPTLENFSRQEAAELIPKSNPFLRKLFGYIAGPDIDDRIKWVVDNLSEIFLACNVEEILRDYGKSTKMEDPIIHFYETFLSEYDSTLRKARGVWYTPQPVVQFMVRAVDEILKTEFHLPEGISDSSKTNIKVNTQISDRRSLSGYKQVEEEVHLVQILDPATGTGTFLAEIIKHIHKGFKGQQGIWSNYVENHLLPRLNGFELLMASYAMAHLKLDLLLSETGFKSNSNQRFKVYLTNSLEEHHQDTGTLFANWLSKEANEANHIKRDMPVMCVIGNPPYSGISSNNGEWIRKLIEDYKYVDGVHFNERKHWLNDDYVKFIRYGQHLIDKKGSGILAFINPHGFLGNPTFKGMRWNLLKTFDKIYTIDLHGNSNIKEMSPDGSPDINVFDIQQGVSINIFIKTGKKKNNHLGEVFHFDLYGRREAKYDFLVENSLKTVNFNKLKPEAPYFFFKNSNNDLFEVYNKGFYIADFFVQNSVGCVTANDGLNISFTKQEQTSKIQDLLEMQEGDWRIKYNRKKDSRDWTYQTAKKDATENNQVNNYNRISYRPFDTRWTLYTGNSRGLYSSPQPKIMKQFIQRENIGLVTARSNKSENCDHFYISKFLMETKCGERTTQSAIFPLYIYPETNEQRAIGQSSKRTPNLNAEIVKELSTQLELIFTTEKETTENTFDPIDILDYIYAVLHSPAYREKYKEFLKIDFPRVPYPKDRDTFFKLVKLGGEIRQLHLLESSKLKQFITQYPIDGNNVVEKPTFLDGKVYINESQYFQNVPEKAWMFFIGGYQPAQKWLKDRKGMELNFDDILHYQKIIVAIVETQRVMNEINQIRVI